MPHQTNLTYKSNNMKTQVLIFLLLGCLYATNANSSAFTQGAALGLNLLKSAEENETSEQDDVEGEASRDALLVTDNLEEGGLVKTSLLNRNTVPSKIKRKRDGKGFQAFPNNTPQLMDRSIKIELSDSQELIPELSYAFKFDNFYTGISYQSLKYSTEGKINSFSESLAGRNRAQRNLKLYPLNWAFKYNDVHYALGAFYSRLEMERTEFGVIRFDDNSDTINFNNEVLLTGQQIGIQGAFLFSNKWVSVRGLVDLPAASRLSITETSLFRVLEDSANRASPSGDMGFAFSTRLDMLVKTPIFIDLNLSASYDRTPLSYEQTATDYNQTNTAIAFNSEPYSSTITTAAVGAGLLLNISNPLDLSPIFEVKLVQQNISDNKASESLVVNNFIISVGFGSSF